MDSSEADSPPIQSKLQNVSNVFIQSQNTTEIQVAQTNLPGTSTQNMDINEQTSSSKSFLESLRYSINDKTPYTVIVESKNKERNVANMHPMQLGKMLMQHNITNINHLTLRGRNRISIEFNNHLAANRFLSNELLKKNELQAFIPRNKVTCQVVIRGIWTGYSEEEILNEQILAVRRLNRRTTRISEENRNENVYIPTGTVVLTISGSTPPPNVIIMMCRFETFTYVLPVIQCLNCLRYGHTQKICRSPTRCAKCQDDHASNVCEELARCIFCRGQHMATSVDCPE